MILGEPRIALESCGSTNDELAARAAAGAETGTAIIAASQSAGRGRGDHPWHSPVGNLYASILLRPAVEPSSVPAIALVAGIAVARALAELGVDARLKWPNDVVVGARKIAGILCESSSRAGRLDHAIVGIGVNLAAVRMPDEIAAIATSVERETGDAPPDPDDAFDLICAELADPLARFESGGVIAIRGEWKRLWRDRGRRARAEIGGVTVEGELIDITADGHLELETDGGERVAVVSGAVEIAE